MNPIAETLDLIDLQIHLTASPAITFQKGFGKVESTDTERARNGFYFDAEAALPYGEINTVLTTYLHGTRLEISEGLINQSIAIDNCTLYGQQGELMIAVTFSGSYKGSAYFRGRPAYDPQTKTIALQHMTYDLKTENVLLKGLKWLFHKLILNEIKKYTVFDIAPYRLKLLEAVTKLLNPQPAEGMRVAGVVKDLDVKRIEAQEKGLHIGMHCRGDLSITMPRLKF